MSGHCESRKRTKSISRGAQIHAVHPRQLIVSHLPRFLAVSGSVPPHWGHVRTDSAIGAPQCVQGFVAIGYQAMRGLVEAFAPVAILAPSMDWTPTR